MIKEFNTEGVCFPENHYVMDTTAKVQEIISLIERGKYFTINRPRQYGKSTILYLLIEHLKKTEDYFPIALSFQGIDTKWHQSDGVFAQMFLDEMIKVLKFTNPTLSHFLKEIGKNVNDMGSLSEAITELVHHLNKKIVLVIDEVDSSSTHDSFLNFLGMLRTKYLARKYPHHATFFSIILAGVHDIKSLKYKIENEKAEKYNSPWNIAVDFEVEMTFNPKEIALMLTQYSATEDIKMNIPAIAKKLYYYTSGYPFLVSKLCKNIVDKILKYQENKTTWVQDDVEASVQLLLKENNTNFDSLIKNLENNQELYDLVARIIINGEVVPFHQYNPTIYQGILYGIFKRNGRIRIHNRIYEQLIYDYMASKLLTSNAKNLSKFNYGGHFRMDNHGLDMPAVLKKFQAFMKEQRSDRDKTFIEREWRLIFLAFLKPIINGQGHDFKEVEISEEKRLDIVVTFYQHKYILELKLWRGPKKHKAGLKQLALYLDIHNVQKGFLVIFDTRKRKTWETKLIAYQGKEIFTIWV